jgi:hypothetical protein
MVRVTIRLLPNKEELYEDFKDIVINDLHSDVCYVMSSLMESFVSAIRNNPKAEDPLIMHFVHQNVQINMGCTFQYMTKRAKRQAPDDTTIISDRHNLIPEFVDRHGALSQSARDYWFKVFQEQGIIPKNPSVSTGKHKRRCKKLRKLMVQCMTFVTAWRKKLRKKA